MEETSVTMYGDTDGTLDFKAKAQTLIGLDEAVNYIYGDAFLIENRKGGNDVLIGGASANYNILHGDAAEMSDSQGGNDLLIGGAGSNVNNLRGDAFQMSESQGGNDVLIGGANSNSNTLFGDAVEISDSQGGNDVLAGGTNSGDNSLYGDANEMSNSQGGSDTLTGGSSSTHNYLYGDALQMYDSKGGNDMLIGGATSNFNVLYGDAFGMSDSRGGNDILVVSDKQISGAFLTQNTLYGDAKYHFAGNAICGNDRLISGTGNDAMWGDIAHSYDQDSPIDLTHVTTGQDVFVFSANNGIDTIHDFRQGEDKIELKGIGVASFDELMAAPHLSQDSTNSVITFGTNTITVIGVTELTAADFIFT